MFEKHEMRHVAKCCRDTQLNSRNNVGRVPTWMKLFDQSTNFRVSREWMHASSNDTRVNEDIFGYLYMHIKTVHKNLWTYWRPLRNTWHGTKRDATKQHSLACWLHEGRHPPPQWLNEVLVCLFGPFWGADLPCECGEQTLMRQIQCDKQNYMVVDRNTAHNIHLLVIKHCTLLRLISLYMPSAIKNYNATRLIKWYQSVCNIKRKVNSLT